ncbi:MAG: methyltransferase domain-containing protein [Spirochaetales bacterium]|nr:methyltransferase domain-containing protein [Spirochaetales bacterium]
MWLFLREKTDLFDSNTKQILHVAPEPCFEPRFKTQLGKGYLTADLFNPRAMVKMDISNISYPDESFDVIYCSHVLEHVPDDRKAISEFFRVLKKDGWAILLVPIGAEKTFEDPSITDPAERLKAFGQEDHVRLYGPDYIDRLREAGFRVKVYSVKDLDSRPDVVKTGLASSTGDIFYCTKQ